MSAPTPGSLSPNMEVELVSQEMSLLSNVLAAYAFMADQRERAALVFVSSVCVGLLFTLCALVIQIHCRTDCHYSDRRHHRGDRRHRHRHHHHHLHRHRGADNPCPLHRPSNAGNPVAAVETSEDSESEEWDETTSDASARRRRRFERTLLHTSAFTSAEELERTQRMEDRERILREIWMNGQPDVNTVTRSLNRYY
ncbi:protein eva-1 homolog A [Aplochiton taeniatus]